jgi:hypothetical protein
MIALQGMNDAENTFLNLGGMFAIVVAIVPTGRGPDSDTAVQACRKSGGTLLTHRASKTLDCPTVHALQEASRANVENNMAALLIVGGLALILAAVILYKGRSRGAGTASSPGTRQKYKRREFAVGVSLYVDRRCHAGRRRHLDRTLAGWRDLTVLG